MIAAMAIELFIWLYGLSLTLVTFVSVALLVTAARYIGRQNAEIKRLTEESMQTKRPVPRMVRKKPTPRKPKNEAADPAP